MEPPLIRLTGISKRYGGVNAVHPVDLDIGYGDFFALLGPSGCGKTTLLRMIGGFLAPSSGTIEIAGLDVTRLGPEKRDTNMVFQGYGLFPHMTVRQNVSYGLRLRKRPAAEIDAAVGKMLALVHLSDFAERLPKLLSGGQQQRVALARALVMQPKVLLLDEPLAALDLSLRKAMQEELRQIHAAIGGTFVFVTHDQSEALSLATRDAVMKSGRIVQSGTPEHIYREPASEFVAGFIGEATTIPVRRERNEVQLFNKIVIPSRGPDREMLAVVRPDGLHFVNGAPSEFAVPGIIQDKLFQGSHVRYKVRTDDGTELLVHIQPSVREHQDPPAGARIAVDMRPEFVWLTERGP